MDLKTWEERWEELGFSYWEWLVLMDKENPTEKEQQQIEQGTKLHREFHRALEGNKNA